MGDIKNTIKKNAIKELKDLIAAFKHDFLIKPISSGVGCTLSLCIGMVLAQVYVVPLRKKGDTKVKNDA